MTEAQRFLDAARILPGDEPDAPARARVAEARGEVDKAIQLLRDGTDADAQSTLFNILVRHRGDEAGLAFLADQRLSVSGLTVNGVHTLCFVHLKRSDIDKLKDTLDAVTDTQFAEGPYLLFLRAVVRLAALFPKPDQPIVLRGPPLDIRFARTVPSQPIVRTELDIALTDLSRIVSLTQEFELHHAKRIAETYITWCELLHPDHHDATLRKLRAAMAVPNTALPQLQFAFAYDSAFNPEFISRYLANREQFGGLDDDELGAAFVVALHGDDGRKLANFIAKNRARLEVMFEAPGVASIEVQALAMAHDATSARLLFEQHKNLFDADLATALEGEIAKADGSDPVAENKRVYEQTKTVESLRALIRQLMARNDHRAVAHYAEILYRETQAPVDAMLAASAFANAGDDDNFMRVVGENSFIEQNSSNLARYYAWTLFRHGKLKDSKRIADRLRGDAVARDHNLEIAIAIESGDWESLAAPLNAYLDDTANHSGPDLIRAAHLSLASGQGQFIALLNAAVDPQPSPHFLE